MTDKDYKTEICELVSKINSQDALKYLYIIVADVAKEQEALAND